MSVAVGVDFVVVEKVIDDIGLPIIVFEAHAQILGPFRRGVVDGEDVCFDVVDIGWEGEFACGKVEIFLGESAQAIGDDGDGGVLGIVAQGGCAAQVELQGLDCV